MEREKRPFGAGWGKFDAPSALRRDSIAISAWSNGPFIAISSLITATHHSGNVGHEWLISISRKGARRPRTREVRRLLRDFNMWPCEEDNHELGIARKFWLPVDPAERGVCECKEDEEQVVEDDGYTWSRKRVEGGFDAIQRDRSVNYSTLNRDGSITCVTSKPQPRQRGEGGADG